MKRATKTRFTRQHAADRRLALIESAIECLKCHGHEGMSVRRIAAHAGVSIGLINHHFPHKNQLIAAAYRHFNSQLIDGLVKAAQSGPSDPRARLRTFFKATFSPPNLDRDVLAVWVVFWGLYRHSREIQGVHRETYRGFVSLVRGMLTELSKESGRKHFSPRLAAIGLTALIDGLWLEWCLDPETFSPREAVALCERWTESL